MELWKDIPGYEGLYQVSSLGRVKSFSNAKKGKLLKPSVDRYGYYRVILYDKERNTKGYMIHRLVALTFIPNPDNLPQIDHIDRNKIDNTVENLRWADYKLQARNKTVIPNSGYTNIKVRYEVCITTEGKRSSKSFKTLEEAIKYRDECYSAEK